jgi:hypothetical protein
MQGMGSDSTRAGSEKSSGSRWLPVAIALLGIASVAAEIWGVVRGLFLIMAR